MGSPLFVIVGVPENGIVTIESFIKWLQHHITGFSNIVRFEPVGDCWLLVIRAPHTLSRYIAVKGSIAIDGVSLTVNAIDKDTFCMNLIPHTLENTNLKHLGVGSRVNLEVDLIARYVERMTQWENESNPA